MPVSSRRFPYVDFKPDRECGNDLLRVDGISKTIGDRKVLDNEDLEDYVEFDKVKKIATVYISGVVEGKKDGRAFMASYDVIKIGGKWRIADAPCGYGMYFYDDDDD